MSFQQYLKNIQVRLLDTGEEAQLGSYQFDANAELRHAVLTYFKYGTEGGSEAFTINIYGDSNTDTPLYSSSSLSVSDLGSLGEFRYGTMRFDFDRVHIDSDINYFMTISSSNYTRNGEIFWFGYVLDQGSNINSRTTSDQTGAQIAFIGYE